MMKEKLNFPCMRERHAIIPLFLPFAGCPHRCLFCAQERQTGKSAERVQEDFVGLAAAFFAEVMSRKSDSRHTEIGFFGGTFTLMPLAQQLFCVQSAAECRKRGIIQGIRCSTRPDATDRARLKILADAGLDIVELGVQSFSDAALDASRRGYTRKTALVGCRNVLQSGMALGIQLLPGMPGSSAETFLEDVHIALELHPVCLRFYPCLVLEGTELANLWRLGAYKPWNADMTIRILGQALRMAWAADVPVIRMGLAPEKNLHAAVLAGPWDASLGSSIQAEALYMDVADILEKLNSDAEHAACGRKISSSSYDLLIPRRCQGFFWGYRGELRKKWAAIGIEEKNLIWTENEAALICH